MKKVLAQSAGFTKKHQINVATGKSLNDMAGSKIVGVTAAAIIEDADKETGEVKRVGVVVDKEGYVYSSISEVVLESMEGVIELLEDGEDFDIGVVSRKSKGNNRDYLSLAIL